MSYSVVDDFPGYVFGIRECGWDCLIPPYPPVFFRSVWKYAEISVS